MNNILGLAALLAAGFDSNSSTSSAQTGDATVKASNSPAPAQAVRVLDVNMCPYLFCHSVTLSLDLPQTNVCLSC